MRKPPTHPFKNNYPVWSTRRKAVIDSSGAYVGQQFDLRVTGINTPPEIVSVPLTKAAPESEYSYRVVATDPENDPLEFGLGVRPEGMSIDTETGAISWLPETLGSFEVEVLVTDAQGATNRQSYTVEVGSGNANRAPAIVSSPVFVAAVGSAYSYDVDAVDPDGDDLSYQLIAGPDGMVVDAGSGVLSWSSPVLGTHNVVVGASDGFVGAAQGFVLAAIENAAPTFDDASVPPAVAVPDKLYSYDVNATDPNGERLLYGLDDASVALGMTLDEFGRLRWTPTAADAGTHGVTVTVTDGAGESVEQSFDLTVTADTVAPAVELRPLSGYYRSGDDFSAEVGSNVTFVVSATDNVGVTGLRLDVDGVVVAVDGNGLASVPFNNVGSAVVSAVAVDAAGNSGSADFEFSVVDFSDTLPPTAILDEEISEKPITSFADVLGTVTDDGAVEYVLEVAPVAGGEFVEVASGSGAVENGKLGEFDPSVLQNDSYVLRLTATDGGGNSSSDSVVVDVAGSLKLGNFRLSFTDLEIPLSGIPISVTRTYDSLNASVRDDFGYGWRLEFRDTDLRTSVRRRTPEEELLGVQSPFSEGERVYVTLPGGERTGFTFKPRGSHLNGYLSYPEAFMYHPEFVADDGGELTLRVKDVNLVRKAGTDEYVENGSGVPYNPADPRFGGVYELVTKSGVVYTIDAVSGDLLTVTDRNDNKLTFSDAGIVSSTGVSVSFERDAAGRIVGVIDPEGNRIGYEYDEFGDLVGVTDREDNTTEFVYDLDDRPHYLEEIIDPLGRSGVRTEYDELGRLQKILDVNGEAVELVYDPDNSTQTVRDVFGNATTYVYDERGNVVTEVDAVGKVVKRTYDGDNNVLTETVVTDESSPEGWTTSFTYDAGGNKLTETDPLGNTTRWTYNRFGQVLTETDPLSRTTSYTYDSNGNLLSTDSSIGIIKQTYDRFGNINAIIDAEGQATLFEYDSFGRVTRQIDALGNPTIYTYDANGKTLTETTTIATANGLQSLVKSWTYDAEGRVSSETDPLGNVTEYEYDLLGNMTAVIEKGTSDRRTEYRYDAKGQLEETVYADGTSARSVYDAAGREIATIDEKGQTTHFIYDALGRLVETIYPDSTPNDLSDNPRTKTEYDKAGRIKAHIDERGNRTEYEYDKTDRRTLMRDALNNETKYTYDAGGNRLTETDARNHTTKFVYDDLGRPAETHFADGTRTITSYNAIGLRSSFTDQAGNTTYFVYDALERPTEVIHPDDTPNDLSDNPRTKTEYNELGWVTAEIDELGNRQEYEYDENGRLIESRYDALGRLTGVVDAVGQRTEYGYDLAGNLIEAEDANQHVTEYEYDKLNRRTAIILPLGQRSETTYDPVGNIASAIDFNGNTITYEYDPLNRNIVKRFPDNTAVEYAYTPTGQIETVKDGRGVTTYDYDVRSRLISQINPDNRFVRYRYDAASNRTAVITPAGTTEYTYDKYNQLETVTDPNLGVTRYTYDKAGNIVRTDQPNNTFEIRQYDDLNRLVFLENTGPSGTISSYRYTLDPVGNRQVVEEGDGRKVEYGYDDLYRLTREKITDPTGSDRAINYTYDAVGNRLSRNDLVDGLTTYVYDDNDRLLNDGSSSYTYDDNGNTLSRIKDATDRAVYTWDYENRLAGAEITKPSGTVDAQYEYDPNGVRVGTIVNGEETRYLVDGNRPSAQVLEEYAPDDTLQAFYVYGKDLISQSRDGTRSFYHVDGLGSTRALTNASGAVTDTYDYEAYGNLLDSAGNTVNNYRFTGEQFDPYLEDYYLRMRYYNPESGRFTTTDPFEGVLTEPLSRVRYPYVHGNPVNAIDPSGMWAEYTSSGQAVASKIFGILNSINPAFRFIGQTAGTIGTSLFAVSVVHQVNLALSKSKIKECNLNGDEDCEAGIPIVFYGQTYRGQSLQKTTEHIKNAIGSGKPSVLSAWATQPADHGTQGKWYKKKGECKCDSLLLGASSN